METAVKLICIVYQGFLMTFFMKCKLNCRKGGRSAFWITAAALIAVGMLQFYSPGLLASFEIRLFNSSLLIQKPLYGIAFLILVLFGAVCSDNKWYIPVFWCFVLVILTGMTTTVLTHIISFRSSSLWVNGGEEYLPIRMMYALLCNALMTAVLLLLLKNKSQNYLLTPKALIPFFVILLIDSLNLEYVYSLVQYTPGSMTLLVINIGCFAAALLTVLVFDHLNAIAWKNREMEQVVETIRQDQKHQTETAEVYNSILRTQHDLKKRMALAETLLAESGGDAGKEALKLIGDTQILHHFITGSVMIDALLNTKYTVMKTNHIRFVYNPYPLSKLPLEEDLFSVLLANILDNAIEGVLRIPGKEQEDSRGEIILTMNRNWNNFLIQCINDYDKTQVQQEDGVFLSSKDSPEVHGIGTRSIRKIVSDAGGLVDFSMGETQFTVDIILPMTDPDHLES